MAAENGEEERSGPRRGLEAEQLCRELSARDALPVWLPALLVAVVFVGLGVAGLVALGEFDVSGGRDDLAASELRSAALETLGSASLQ